MEKPTKQRIAGVIVAVILLAVILLLLFIGSETSAPTTAKVTGQSAVVAEATQAVWAVHIGSFTTKEHATALIKKLQQAGFNAYLNEVVTSTKIFYRVFVGAESSRQQANHLKAKLQNNFHLQGIVVEK